MIASALLVNNNESVVVHQPKLMELLDEIDRETSPKQEYSINEERAVSTSNINFQKKEGIDTTSFQESVVNTEASDDTPGKKNIIKMLNNFNTKDLARIESILKHLNDKTPDEQFNSEPIDANWSLKKQAELEYTFYEQSALKDFGTLESIRCKSETCQVRVQVPADLSLKPSHYMDWSNPVSVSINPKQDDLELSTIEIYISRE